MYIWSGTFNSEHEFDEERVVEMEAKWFYDPERDEYQVQEFHDESRYKQVPYVIYNPYADRYLYCEWEYLIG